MLICPEYLYVLAFGVSTIGIIPIYSYDFSRQKLYLLLQVEKTKKNRKDILNNLVVAQSLIPI